MENITCCFTGHRKIVTCEPSEVSSELVKTITQLIQRGYTRFVAGGALGFDTLAAQAVLSLRKQYTDITLHLVLPCPEQTKMWNVQQKELYSQILEEADSSEYVCDTYTKWCMAQRNRRMVDMSSVVVAYYDNSGKGGTAFTVKYATKKGIEIINLF